MKTTRRTAIKSAAGSTLAIAGLSATSTQAQAPKRKANPKFRVKNGRIKQSIMGWTFKPMPVPELARLSKEVGLVAMEGISRDHYPLLKKLDLDVSLLGSHGFKKGPVDPKNHDECLAKLTEAIEVCAGAGYKRVITFTGMKAEGIDDEQAEKNCIKLWKKVLPLAEKKKVTLCLEHLNSRDDSHPMKGHPGYFGDGVDHCVKMIEKIGSPSFKLLFGVYHVQIMNGGVIRPDQAVQGLHWPLSRSRKPRASGTGRQAGNQLSPRHERHSRNRFRRLRRPRIHSHLGGQGSRPATRRPNPGRLALPLVSQFTANRLEARTNALPGSSFIHTGFFFLRRHRHPACLSGNRQSPYLLGISCRPLRSEDPSSIRIARVESHSFASGKL